MLVTPTKNCNQKWTILFILCLREYACGWKKVVKFKAIRIKHSSEIIPATFKWKFKECFKYKEFSEFAI